MKKRFQPILYVSMFSMVLSLIFLSTRSLPKTHSSSIFPSTPINTASATWTVQTAIPSVTIAPTSDPDYFRNDFDGPLDTGWQWVNEDASHWSLNAGSGSLQIDLTSGRVSDGTIQNMLMRPAPTGNFQVTIGLTFRAIENDQFAGLILYESATRFLQIGRSRSVCEGPDQICDGSGIYLQFYDDQDPKPLREAKRYSGSVPLHLRLTRIGDEYAIEMSKGDGLAWFRYGNYTIKFKPTYIGLFAGQNFGQPITALFDYFEVSGLK